MSSPTARTPQTTRPAIETVDCDENPDHEDCAVAPLCTDDDIDDLVWQTLQPKELAADIPAIETVDHDGYVVYEFDASYGDTPTANASSGVYQIAFGVF